MKKIILRRQNGFLSLSLLLLCFTPGAYAQFDSLGLNTPWRKGTLHLSNNTSRSGLVRFNDKLALIAFKETPDAEEESFSERSIHAMKFFDTEQSKWRQFATFNLKQPADGKEFSLLLEILLEFEKYALLSRLEPVHIATREHRNQLGERYQVKVGYEQLEKFCLAGEDGTAALVLMLSYLKKDRPSFAARARPYLNKNLIKKYVGKDWEIFEQIVKEKKLNLKEKEDFILAFQELKARIQY